MNLKTASFSRCYGQSGHGAFPCAPSVIVDEMRKRYNVSPVGTLDEVRVKFYAVSVEKKLKHPVLVAINEEARKKIFGNNDN